MRIRAALTLLSTFLFATSCDPPPPPNVPVEARTWIRNYGVPGVVVEPAAITALSDGGYGITGELLRDGRQGLLLMKLDASGELVRLGGERALAIGEAATGVVPAGAGPTRDGGAALAGLSGGTLHVVRLDRDSEVDWSTEVRQIVDCEEPASVIHTVRELEDRAVVVLGRCRRLGRTTSFAAVLETTGAVRYASPTLHRDPAADISLFAVTMFADRYYFGGRIDERCLVFGTPPGGGGTYSTYEEGAGCTITSLEPVGGRLVAAASMQSAAGPVLRALSLDADLTVLGETETSWAVAPGPPPTAGNLYAWPFSITSLNQGPLFFGPGPGFEAQVLGHESPNLDSAFFLDRLAIVDLEAWPHGAIPGVESGTIYYGRHHVRLIPETQVLATAPMLGCARGTVSPYSSEPGDYLVFDPTEPCVARVFRGELLWRKTAVEGNGRSTGRAVAPAFAGGLLAAGARVGSGREAGLVVAHDGDAVVFERTIPGPNGLPSGFTAVLRDGDGWVLGGYAGPSAWLVRLEPGGEVGWSRVLPHPGAIRAMERTETGSVWLTTGEVTIELDAALAEVGAVMVAPVADIAGAGSGSLAFLQLAPAGWSFGSLAAGAREPTISFLATDPLAEPWSDAPPKPPGSAMLVRTGHGTRVALVEERRGAGSCGERCGDLGIWSGGRELVPMYGTAGDERLVDVTAASDDGLVILATTTGFRASERDLWVLKLGADGAIGEQCDVSAEPSEVYSETSSTASAEGLGTWPAPEPLGSDRGDDPRVVGLPVDAGRTCAGFLPAEPPWATLSIFVMGDGHVALRSIPRNGVLSEPGRFARCPVDCAFEVPTGDQVSVVAEPSPGWSFDRWTGICNRSWQGTEPSVGFALTADESCTVSFTRTSTTPGGPLDCPDGVDGDADGLVDEDRCTAPLQVTCSGGVSTPALSPVTLMAMVSGGTAIASGWEVVSAPPGSTARPSPPSAETTTFTPLLAGTYRLRFTATDGRDQISACETQVEATVMDGLRIELIWNSTVAEELDKTDLDLHLLEPVPDSLWFGLESDCHWANCKDIGLAWGAPGAQDDPRLDLDDLEGRGPENINIDSPPVTELPYRVGVHYWNNNDRMEPSSAIVNIYCYGRLEQTLGPVMLTATGGNEDENQLWKVADVRFGPSTCSITPLLAPEGAPLVVAASEARRER